MSDEVEIRHTDDLININEEERDIIIELFEKISDTSAYFHSVPKQQLHKRFTDWRDTRNANRRAQAAPKA